MFLRKTFPRGRGRGQIYWELVESYRTPGGSRQRTIAYLGKLSRREVSGWQKISARLDGETCPAPGGLFDAEQSDEADDVELVDIEGLSVTRLRSFGDVFLGLTLWRVLGLDRLLAQRMPAGRELVGWDMVAAILCVARFCRPSSELHIEKHFYPQSALPDLLGVEPSMIHTDRLYAGLDQLLMQKKAIEQHLRQRLGELFELSYDVLLYDLTSTYFEGQCAANPKARRGYSRDSRPDCPQVVIALIVTTDGYPLGYEVLAGNTADSTTVRGIVEKVEAEHGKLNRIWVMDRGNVSAANLAFIRQRGGQYIVGTPKAMLRQVRGQISDEGWTKVREGIEVRIVHIGDEDAHGTDARGTDTQSTDARGTDTQSTDARGTDTQSTDARGTDTQSTDARGTNARNAKGACSANKQETTETLVLCRSRDRIAKESAMLNRFTGRLEKGIERLARSAATARLRDIETANRRLGRLLEKNWRAANCFNVNITPIDQPRDDQPRGKATLQITWTKNDQAKQDLCGCYLLRTNLPDPDPVALWQQYIQLVDAEWAFRITKDELQLRPVWHQQDHRVQGHILVCFIAYAMWKTLAGWMRASGLGDAPRPLLEELSTIKSADVHLPTRCPGQSPDPSPGPTLVVRCVTRPDEHQSVLLNRLGIEMPNHLKRFRLEADPLLTTCKCSGNFFQKTPLALSPAVFFVPNSVTWAKQLIAELRSMLRHRKCGVAGRRLIKSSVMSEQIAGRTPGQKPHLEERIPGSIGSGRCE